MNEAEPIKWRMPAEWQPHAGTWVSWPHNHETWPHNLKKAQKEFRNLINVIAESDGCAYICLNGDEMSAEYCKQVEPYGRTVLCDIPTNDAWARDFAPTFVVADKPYDGAQSSETVPPWFPRDNAWLGAVDWRYNAWGGKYPPFEADQKVAEIVAQQTGASYIHSNLCLEGGAIEVNESGILLTTRSCVLNANRNPEWSIEAVETELKSRLGIAHVIWLSGEAIEGDDTDGHIDQLARFVNDTTIVYAWTEDRSDPQFPELQQNLEDLQRGLERLNLNYDLIPLVLPKDPVMFRDQKLPGSYCNFYITNETVIVPQFQDVHDQLALKVLSEHFPNRDVVGLPSTNLTVGLGSFHCLTQQMPKP